MSKRIFSRMMRILFLTWLVSVFLLPTFQVPSVRASTPTTTILTPVADATIDFIFADANFGRDHTLEVQYLSSRQVRHALIRFNLAAALPPEAIIDSAQLNLFLEWGDGAERITLIAARLIEDWAESEVTWNNRPETGDPVVATLVNATRGYKSLDVTDIVQAWHNVPHYGLELWGLEGEMAYSFFFESREHGEMPPQLAVTYHLPRSDLVVTDVWRENGLICYQIRNVGDGVAPEGHLTALFIDGELLASDLVVEDLGPGERWRGCFDFKDIYTQPEYSVMVWADYNEEISELSEANNRREESWKYDVTPPDIVSGPTVWDVAQTSAVLFWETNEDSDSVVKFGKKARIYDLEETDSVQTRVHSATLAELEPSTTYHFVVKSTDPWENTVESRDKTFETLPLFDDIAPSVALIDPGVCQGTVAVSADASDNTGVEKVEFYMDDELLFTDYSLPYEFSVDTTKFLNGEHLLKAVAYDPFEQSSTEDLTVDVANVIDKTLPTVTITSPKDGDTVPAGKIKVNATLTDDTGLAQAYFKVSIQGAVPQFEGFEGFPSYPKSKKVTFEWDARFLNGKCRLAVEVYDKEGKYNYATCDVDLVQMPPPPQPKLKIKSRDVTRQGNYFTIGLTVENVGDADATNIVIEDFLRGFQPISRTSKYAEYEAEFVTSFVYGVCTISFTGKITPQGGWAHFPYEAVPVLIYPNPLLPLKLDPSIGNPVKFWYEGPDGSEYYEEFHIPVPKTTAGDTIPAAHAKALKAADYLIVTNPQRLFWYMGTTSTLNDDVNGLLSTMAELARCKCGAMGYLYTYDKYTFRDLIKQGGLWSSKLGGKLGSSWTSVGYLLIVGETEIVPAWGGLQFGTLYTQMGQVVADRPIIADCTDYPYASTDGDWIKPELSIGRIIGNNAKELKKPIETSINVHKGEPGYGFDRSTYFAVAGYPKGLGGGAAPISCTKEVYDVGLTLLKKGVKGVMMFNPDFTQYNYGFQVFGVNETATKNTIINTFFSFTPNRDVIFLSGHGNSGSWDVITTADVTKQANPFGSTNPIVYASACSTGTYSAGFSLAEAFLSRGAAVYYGATKWGLDSHTSINKKVYEKWQAGASFAMAVRWTKRSLSDSISDKYWAAIYHVFGDPKFGWEWTPPSSVTSSALLGQTEAPSSIDVVIPDYEVTRVDGEDHVEIPDGDVLFTPGTPLVPYYQVFYEYPKGYKIQDVALTGRSEPIAATGLNIPMIIADNIGGNPAYYGASSQLQQLESLEWWPDRVFKWTAFESPESTTLAITIFPFYYNHLTTDVKFYRNFSFDVDFTIPSVEITKLETNKHVYNLGEPVGFDLELYNAGTEGKDVVVSAAIRKEGSDEVVSGLRLRTLKNLRGQASYSQVWESSGFEPGFYNIIVELKDTQGTLLDKQIEGFRLGVDSGEITSLTATPEYFHIGDNIDIQMAFRNTGTGSVTGSAIVEILDSAGDVVDEFVHTVADLMPSESISFSDTWDASGAMEGSYDVVGYVLYDGKATDPAIVTVQTDYAPPSITVKTPSEGQALQDGVTLEALVTDPSGVDWLTFSIREPNGEQGTIIDPMFESMPTTYSGDDEWQLPFDTTQLPDGYYLLLAKASDMLGNEGYETIEFSIRNWACVELLPASESNKAGRTMPVKFSLRVAESVDPAQPFVHNEELTILIYKEGHPESILQESTYGDTARDYRIDSIGELYITNFRTRKTPTKYVVEVYRKGMLIGWFTFETVK